VLCIVHCVGGNRSCFLFFFVAELQPQPTLYKSSVTSNAACPDLLICSVYIQANSGGISQTSVLATAMNGALIVPSTVNTVRTSTCLSYANPYSTNPSVVWNSTYIKGTFLGSFAQGTPAFVTFNVAISGLGDGLNSVKLQVTGYDVNFFQGTQTFCCGACCPSGCATQSQTLSFTSSAPTSAMVGGATYSVVSTRAQRKQASRKSKPRKVETPKRRKRRLKSRRFLPNEASRRNERIRVLSE
jgi:hypothetical protein